MKLLITLYVYIELSIVAFCLKSDASRTQATCPAFKEKVDELKNYYDGLFN